MAKQKRQSPQGGRRQIWDKHSSCLFTVHLSRARNSLLWVGSVIQALKGEAWSSEHSCPVISLVGGMKSPEQSGIRRGELRVLGGLKLEMLLLSQAELLQPTRPRISPGPSIRLHLLAGACGTGRCQWRDAKKGKKVTLRCCGRTDANEGSTLSCRLELPPPRHFWSST